MRNCPYEEGTLNYDIYRSLWSYPMLYKNGGQVLHHMFVVIGNGCDWEDGKLIYRDYEEKDQENVFRSEEEVLKTHSFADENQIRECLIDLRKENSDMRFVRDNAAELTLDIYRPWKTLYPISQYSAMYTLPADAKPEYVEACRTCIDLAYEAIFNDCCSKQPKTKKYPADDSTQSSIEWADKSQKMLIEKFGNRIQAADIRQSFETWTCYADYVAFKKEVWKDVNKTFKDIVKNIK